MRTKEEKLKRRELIKSLFIDYQLDDIKNLPQVVSFSGGRTSGLMLRKLLDLDLKLIVLFGNTGKERDETLDFIHEVETQWSIPVVWLEYTRIKTSNEFVDKLKTKRMRDYANKQDMMHWFKIVDYNTAARHNDKHTPFDELLEWMTALPNARARACTAQLKMRTMQRYLWSQGIYKFVNHIGFRYDELDRIVDIENSTDKDKDVLYRFILAEQKLVQDDINSFWETNNFNLKLQQYEGNCHLCFLKKRKVKQQLIREQPDLVKWWKDWEDKKAKICSGNGAKWNRDKGCSINELINDVQQENCDIKSDAPFDCNCTAGVTLGTEYDDE